MPAQPESPDAGAELAPESVASRVYESSLRPGIADANGTRRVRLDAIARWLQDVALADLIDAGLAGRGIWVVRRSRIRVERFPRFGDELRLRTFCVGIGRFTALRRTTIAGEHARVEAEALWVFLDAETQRPRRFSEEFLAAYRPRTGTEPNARLRHPDPPEECERRPFAFRATDVDVAAHVNNSHYWVPFEAELAADGAADPAPIDAEIEYRAAAQPGDHLYLRAGEMRWIASAEGEVLASLALG